MSDIERILAFLDGTGPDHMDRYMDEYLHFRGKEWEACHDHVQWAFPTQTASKFNPDAPVIPKTVGSIGVTDRSRANHLALFQNYMASLNISVDYVWDDGHLMGARFALGHVTDDYPPNPWLSRNNHNFLRITRVLESLGLVQNRWIENIRRDFAEFLFYTVVPSFSGLIDSMTVVYWMAAYEGKLDKITLVR